jgi:DNA polymerase III subunit epsilon
MREVVLDTETTGLNYKAGDRVIEVGCLELLNHVPSGKNLQFYCSVNKKIDERATKIHGITNEFLQNCPTFEDQAESFINFINEDTLIIHNADFDMGFINNELSLIGKEKLNNKVIDTVALARKTLNTRIANLDYLCRRFSIDLSNRKQHGALLDAELLADVYLELNGGKQISMNLLTREDIEKKVEKKNINNPAFFSKISVTDEDVLRHKVLIKDIKNSVWKKIDY